jgi:hypothetical protein
LADRRARDYEALETDLERPRALLAMIVAAIGD